MRNVIFVSKIIVNSQVHLSPFVLTAAPHYPPHYFTFESRLFFFVRRHRLPFVVIIVKLFSLIFRLCEKNQEKNYQTLNPICSNFSQVGIWKKKKGKNS